MAKIISFHPTGQWRELFKFDVALDNGVSGTVFSKSEHFRFDIGEDVAHELNEKGTLKLQKAQYAGQPSTPYAPPTAATSSTGASTKDELIIRQVALKAAVEFVSTKQGAESEVLPMAQRFNDWVLGKPAQGHTHAAHFDEESPF